MAQILVRNLDTKTVEGLKARAKRHGRSLQSEAKMLLENASGQTMANALEDAREVRGALGRKFKSSVELIREDRQR